MPMGEDAPISPYERGIIIGRIGARLTQHDEALKRVDEIVTENSRQLRDLVIAVTHLTDRFGAHEEAARQTREALAERSARVWSPWARMFAVIAAVASVASIAVVLDHVLR